MTQNTKKHSMKPWIYASIWTCIALVIVFPVWWIIIAALAFHSGASIQGLSSPSEPYNPGDPGYDVWANLASLIAILILVSVWVGKYLHKKHKNNTP